VVDLLLGEERAEVDARNEVGATPLHLAARNGHAQVVRLLLDRGATPDATTSAGATALQLARQEGHEEIAELLQSHPV
jgi:ankyrin repeat protein